jgi:hypothetical protein
VEYIFKLLPDISLDDMETIQAKMNALPLPETEKKEIQIRFRTWKAATKRSIFFEKNKWILVVLLTALFLWGIKMMMH